MLLLFSFTVKFGIFKMRVSARKFETEIYKFIQIRLQIWTQNDKARYREMIFGVVR